MFAGRVGGTQIFARGEASSEPQRLRDIWQTWNWESQKGLGKVLRCFRKGSGVNDVVLVEFLTFLKPNLPESYVHFSAHFLDLRNSQSF